MALFEEHLACPYFVPREILNDGSWPHPARLPLGAGWSGTCCASATETAPSDEAIREFCNLGYARGCPHLPADRQWDSIRFSVATTSIEQVVVWYVCEQAHAPVDHGKLAYDMVEGVWRNSHPDARVQRLAQSYLEAWRMRQDVVVPSERRFNATSAT